MHILGVGGHMRRIYNPTQYEFLQPLQHWNVFITVSALCLGAVAAHLRRQLLLEPVRRAEGATRNPWHANTLEWEAPTPPPHGNFPGPLPTVYRGPYEYSSPQVDGGLPAAGAAARAAGGASRRLALTACADPGRPSISRRPRVHWTGAAASRQRGADYVALTKPRVVTMVLVTTLVGFYLGTDGHAVDSLRLLAHAARHRRSPPAARWR